MESATPFGYGSVYQCNVCAKTFANNASLEQHFRAVHLPEAASCPDQCSYGHNPAHNGNQAVSMTCGNVPAFVPPQETQPEIWTQQPYCYPFPNSLVRQPPARSMGESVMFLGMGTPAWAYRIVPMDPQWDSHSTHPPERALVFNPPVAVHAQPDMPFAEQNPNLTTLAASIVPASNEAKAYAGNTVANDGRVAVQNFGEPAFGQTAEAAPAIYNEPNCRQEAATTSELTAQRTNDGTVALNRESRDPRITRSAIRKETGAVDCVIRSERGSQLRYGYQEKERFMQNCPMMNELLSSDLLCQQVLGPGQYVVQFGL